MQIEGLIPFKSCIDQAITSLYFLKISSRCCSSSLVNADDIIIGFYFFGSKKAYSTVLINPSRLTFLNLFMFLFPFLHCCLIFLCYSHSNLILFPLNQKWNIEIQNQDHQDTGNSSHFN